jgi:hypothetical protein
MSTTRPPATTVPGPNNRLYRRWITACTLGELIGIGVAGATAVGLQRAFGDPRSWAGRLGLLAVMGAVGAIEGAALAGFQWRVLRERLPRLRAAEWMTPTVAVAVAGWVLGMAGPIFTAGEGDAPSPEPGLPFVLLIAAAIGAGAGACFGAAQWWVLRRHAEAALRWVPIHAAGWAAAMAAIFLGASLPSARWPMAAVILSGAAGGVLGGFLLGVITGLVARSLAPRVR